MNREDMDTFGTSPSVQQITSNILHKLGDIVNQGNVSNINVNIDIDTESMEVVSISIQENVIERNRNSIDSNSSYESTPRTRTRSRDPTDDTYVILQPVANICEFVSFVDNDLTGECCICLNEYLDIPHTCKRKLKKCEHTFCELCLSEWLKAHDKCPLCKDVIIST
tara:strand:+ start:5853 stop:6353 length:501 start_codon:yes stop_codon:yes gene_type:complete